MLQAMPTMPPQHLGRVLLLSVLALASNSDANPRSADTDFNDDGDSGLFWPDYSAVDDNPSNGNNTGDFKSLLRRGNSAEDDNPSTDAKYGEFKSLLQPDNSAEEDNPSTDIEYEDFKSLLRPDSTEDENPSTDIDYGAFKSLLRPDNSTEDDNPSTGSDNGDIDGLQWPDYSAVDDDPSTDTDNGDNNGPDGHFRGDFSTIRIISESASEITTQTTSESTSERTTTPTVSEELLVEENRTVSRLRHRLLRFKSAETASSAGGGAALGFDPYVGQWVPCTSAQRECLRFGTLFDPRRGRCLLSADEWCHAVPPDRRPALADGRAPLVASCPAECASEGAAGSAQCRAATWGARGVACACGGALAAPRPLAVGGFACACAEGEGDATRAITQPSEGRRCRVPPLHLPWTQGSPLDPRRLQALLATPLPLRCDARQRLCARNHTVWAPGSVGCQPLLQKRSSACPEGQWLALDAQAALQGDLRARCVRRDGGCEAEAEGEAKGKGKGKGKGRWRRALFDGRCHRLSTLRLLLTAPPRPTLFGEYHAPHAPLRLWLRARHNDSEAACELRHAATDQPSDEPISTTPAPAPQLNASAALLKYRRFHAADALVGAPIACSYEQKLCFRHNTLYNPATGRCLPNQGSPNAPPLADADEILRGSGQLVASATVLTDPCPGYRMAYDGRCYSKALVKEEVCGCAAEPTPHFLGGVECRCGAATPAVQVSQPPEDGHCRVPDLRFPDHDRSWLEHNHPLLHISWTCSGRQHDCFEEGKVWMSDPDGCYTLFARGPCPPDHTVVLARGGDWRGSAVCARDCPSGWVRLAFDGQCHARREIDVLSPPDTFLSAPNLSGERAVVATGVNFENLTLSVSAGECVAHYDMRLIKMVPRIELAPLRGAGRDGAILEVHTQPPAEDHIQ